MQIEIIEHNWTVQAWISLDNHASIQKEGLILKVPATTAANSILKYFYFFFKEHKPWHFMWIAY